VKGLFVRLLQVGANRVHQLDGRSVAFGIPYKFYVGTHNENHPFIEQKRVFDSLGEDLGVLSFHCAFASSRLCVKVTA
jgi:hypothetical protein